MPHLYLSSAGRAPDESASDCTLTLSLPVTPKSLTVTDGAATIGLYVVRSGLNDQLTFTRDGTTNTITVPQDTYTAAELESELASRMVETGNGAWFVTLRPAAGTALISETSDVSWTLDDTNGRSITGDLGGTYNLSSVSNISTFSHDIALGGAPSVNSAGNNFGAEHLNPAGSSGTGTLSEGYYSVQELADEFKTQLDALGLGTFTVTNDNGVRSLKTELDEPFAFDLSNFSDDVALQLGLASPFAPGSLSATVRSRTLSSNSGTIEAGTNDRLDFEINGNVVVVQFSAGSKSNEVLASTVQSAVRKDGNGLSDFVCEYKPDEEGRYFLMSSATAFGLLNNSGPSEGRSAHSLFGFDGTDRVSTASGGTHYLASKGETSTLTHPYALPFRAAAPPVLYVLSPELASVDSVIGTSSFLYDRPVLASLVRQRGGDFKEHVEYRVVSTTTHVFSDNVTRQKLTFQVVDAHGAPVLLNGADWSLSVEYET
jgi:hypothetical protein